MTEVIVDRKISLIALVRVSTIIVTAFLLGAAWYVHHRSSGLWVAEWYQPTTGPCLWFPEMDRALRQDIFLPLTALMLMALIAKVVAQADPASEGDISIWTKALALSVLPGILIGLLGRYWPTAVNLVFLVIAFVMLHLEQSLPIIKQANDQSLTICSIMTINVVGLSIVWLSQGWLAALAFSPATLVILLLAVVFSLPEPGISYHECDC